MKQVFVKSQINDMPQWAKGVVGVALVAGVGIAIYTIYRKIKKLEEQKGQTQVIGAVSEEIKQAEKSGEKLSFPLSTYQSACNTIEQYLSGCETPSTELKTIKLVLSVVKKNIDWLQLVKSFGVRKIDDCGFLFSDSTNYELNGLLDEQLDWSMKGGVYNREMGLKLNDYQDYRTGDILKQELRKRGVKI
jgi:hypothetical protein